MCEPIKCIIVDDEPIAREGLERLVRKSPMLELVGNFESAESATEYIKDSPVDLIFLDIEMPGTNGLDFARKIPQQTLVIFTTAYSEYALDSYEVNATDYLVKPIEEQRFRKAVEKVSVYHTLLINAEKESVEADVDFFFVKSDRKYFKIRYDDILFIEGLKDYVIIQTKSTHHYQDVPAHYPRTSASVCFLPHQQILCCEFRENRIVRHQRRIHRKI